MIQTRKGFPEMHRVLKPGGKFMCLEFSEPVTPWFRALDDLYSFRVMPALGQMLADCSPAQTYLPEPIRMFPGPELKQALNAARLIWQDSIEFPLVGILGVFVKAA